MTCRITKRKPSKKRYYQISGGPIELMKQDREIYHDIEDCKIYKFHKGYYGFYVNKKQFHASGRRFL